MNSNKIKIKLPLLLILLMLCVSSMNSQNQEKTVVSIEGDKFYINGKPTFKGRTWQGMSVEGLLPNSRMVQGIFLCVK